MAGFTAKLDLPVFVSKEQILGKEVFDSELHQIGFVKDWTYSADGVVKMVVGTKDKKSVLVPFSYIEKVGQFVLLKSKVYLKK